MATSTAHQFNDIVVSIFQLDAGEKIARHKHSHVHTTGVARGKTEVEIYRPKGAAMGKPIFESEILYFEPGVRDMPFPPDVEHEIRALVSGTIVVNISMVQNPPAPFAVAGGIALIDGTVITPGYDDEEITYFTYRCW